MLKRRSRFIALTTALFATALVGCAPISSKTTEDGVSPMSPYCSTVKTYSSPVVVTGTAKYRYRAEGNGVIPNGHNAFVPSATTGTFSLDMTITGDGDTETTTKDWTCVGTCDAAMVVDALTTAINSSVTGVDYLKASGDRVLGLTPTDDRKLTVSNLQGLTAINKKPIRYAEIKVTDSSGDTVQCGETDGNGSFSIDLPSNGKTYNLKVLSRANNDHNTAYVLNSPKSNSEYSISTKVKASGSPSVSLIAPATGDLEGGAFNILDQILNAQEYLRTTTDGCSSDFAECKEFNTAPMVYVYWKKGFNPGSYVGSGPVSFYCDEACTDYGGARQLFILGGLNGDTDVSDMDHFDNSIIIHEYGHFIEAQFSRPDSPGGSHDGNSVIDPRLAWGEGWANFFQAAVTQDPYYRDTIGHVCDDGTMDCSEVAFDEYLDPSGSPDLDEPTTLGEGNFREFSVSRVLWDIVKTGGVSTFSEIWTVLTGTDSMETISDRFKSIGRFHKLQRELASPEDWSTVVSDEMQRSNLKDYANPLRTSSCTSSSTTAMAIKKVSDDEGSPDTSLLLENNDFLIFDHPGGTLSVKLTWAGADDADLDLYVYKKDYVYGSKYGLVDYSYDESDDDSGSESVSKSVAAGKYMINVVAYTGLSNYFNGSTYNTAYKLKVNGDYVCPTY